MSSLEFDALSNSRVWYYMKLMDSASFLCFTRVSNQMHVTKLASLGWMITLWIITEFEKKYSEEFTNCISINDDVSVPVLKTSNSLSLPNISTLRMTPSFSKRSSSSFHVSLWVYFTRTGCNTGVKKGSIFKDKEIKLLQKQELVVNPILSA